MPIVPYHVQNLLRSIDGSITMVSASIRAEPTPFWDQLSMGCGNKDYACSEYDEMTALKDTCLEFLLDGPEKVCVVSPFSNFVKTSRLFITYGYPNILIRRVDGIIQR
ncbi:hypothetical protein TWF718_009891 [Orbilia javanica]|uniref:Uncharacterized protein n=1 Tax=Orbilia javanica TaxID=47235 RepID=A0AAN8RFC9_9PEZI